MREAASSSSSPANEPRLQAIALELLHDTRSTRISCTRDGSRSSPATSSARSATRPSSPAHSRSDSGEWQLLDGHQRLEALRRLGHANAVVFPWNCDGHCTVPEGCPQGHPAFEVASRANR